MSLNLALVISGDASGAKAAAEETNAAVHTIGVTATNAANTQAAANDQAVAASRRVTEALTGQEAAQRRQGAAAAASLASVANASRLTSNQLLRLSQQGNDVITMWALGAPGLMIFASQAGQVYDALESGPKGLRGSLAAIRASLVSTAASFISFAGPVGLIATSIAVAGAAFVTYSIMSREATKSLDEALKAQLKSITELGNAYGLAGIKAEDFGRKSVIAAEAAARRDIADLKRSLDAASQDVQSQLVSRFTIGRGRETFFAAKPEFQEFGAAISILNSQIERGVPNYRQFEDSIAAVVANNPGLQTTGDKILGIVAAAAEAAKQLQRSDEIIKDINRGSIGGPGALDRAQQYGREELERRRRMGTDPFASVRINPAADQAGIAQRREAAAAQLQALLAISPAEKAAAARAEAAAQYIRGESDVARADRIDIAGKLALASATKSLSDAQKERFRSLDQTLAAQQFDISLIGRTAGETARLRMEFELTSQVREEAARNNVAVDEAEIQRIKEKAAEYGRMAEAAARANLARELQFERDQLGRSPIEATVADRLKGAGLAVDLNSEAAAMIRMNELLKQQKQLWEDVRETGVDVIGGIVDSALGGFTDIDSVLKGVADDVLKQLTQLAIKNPLANALYDKGLPTLDSIGGIGGFIGTLLGGPQPDGGQTVGAMDVQAGVVNINGALGIGGTGGVGGPLGAITRLLSGANDNSATGGAAASATSQSGIGAQIWNFFAGKGLQSHQIAGIMGNLTAESGLNPNAVNPNGGATGLPQWLGSRLTGLLSANGGKVPGVGGQLDYIWKELQGPESGVLKRLLGSNDVRSATGAFAGFERAEGWSQANPENIALWQKRLTASQDALARFQGTATAATKDLGTFGGGLGQLGNALSQFPTAPAGGGGGWLSWLAGLFGGGASLSPGAWAAIQAGGGGLYDVGGSTGGSDPYKVAGLVHEQEYVMDAPVVRALGVPFLDSLRRTAKSGRGYYEGGYAMPGAGSSGSASVGGWSSQSAQPARIERHYHDYAGVSVREEETDDGKGGRREDIIIEEKLTAAANRRGSSFNKTLASRGARQPVKRR
ncbi:phage tail tip lysozyme [Mesorhizobium sp. M0808]|uniref:phage tail tip lysozyme n=1 Tax=Mesorhizobium sp. M0808 TaxID=2957002 RepID=UPI00333D985D